MTYTVSRQLQTRVCEAGAEEQALHIASWHPAVALAAADLLDEAVDEADGIKRLWAEQFGKQRPKWAEESTILRFARAYLGESP